MTYICSPLLAMGVAVGVVLLELVTLRYSRQFFLLWNKSWALYVYALMYGIVALLITFGLNQLEIGGAINLQGIGLSNPWIRAVAIGVFTKAFFHMRLFNIPVGSFGTQSFPIGLETIVQVFEPQLLKTIELHEFNAVRQYIEPRAAKYKDLATVRAKINENIPRTFTESEKSAIRADIDKQNTIVEAMELYLVTLGKSNFDRVFPA